MTMPVALVGPPNCGKSTLFNALTGLHQTQGNYPGCTVEKKSGIAHDSYGNRVEIIDLPGTYSLTPHSPDEAVTRDALCGQLDGLTELAGVLLVVNMSHLDRQLALVLQVRELGLPMALVLNMADLARESGVTIDRLQLSEALGGVEVIVAQATTRQGIPEIRQVLSKFGQPKTPPRQSHLPLSVPVALPGHFDASARSTPDEPDAPRSALPAAGKRLWWGNDFLEAKLHHIRASFHPLADPALSPELLVLACAPGQEPGWLSTGTLKVIHAEEADYLEATGTPLRQEISRRRFAEATSLAHQVLGRHFKPSPRQKVTDRIDAVLLHPLGGWVVFIGLMFALFWGIFYLAPIPADYLEAQIAALAQAAGNSMSAGPLRDLIAEGVIPGVGGVLVFLPQILLLFLALGILETSGYMSRAAVLMDRPMRLAGLPGKAFIPLLSAYACAIPGMLATRTISNSRDRLLTLLVLPWMSCSARLPVYALMIAVLFGSSGVEPWQQALVMTGLYFLGTSTAMIFARMLRKTAIRIAPSPMLAELPAYQFPDWKYISRMLAQRGWQFVRRAGTLILAISVILWALSAFPKSADPATQAENSYLGQAGRAIEPAFAPLGFDWRISTGVLASFAAREVFNSHMAILFHANEPETSNSAPPDGEAVNPGEPDEETAELANDFLAFNEAKRPDGSALFTPDVSLAILVFYVFALQCLPTVIVARREMASWKLAIAQLAGMSAFAWLAACAARWIFLGFSGMF